MGNKSSLPGIVCRRVERLERLKGWKVGMVWKVWNVPFNCPFLPYILCTLIPPLLLSFPLPLFLPLLPLLLPYPMQLFITPYTLKETTLSISNPEIVEQARKVLRIASWDHFFVQDTQPGKQAQTRIEVQFSSFAETHQGLALVGEIIKQEACPMKPGNDITLFVAMPNKREKAELIVQKLCEIGIPHITFWPAERSVIKQRNEKKAERLLKIAKEAVEQSRGWVFPEISFVEKIDTLLEWKKIVIFDKSDDVLQSEWNEAVSRLLHSARNDKSTRSWFVWPEGGRWAKDWELFKKYDYEIQDLWATILRMETAAIVWAWLLKNDRL